MKNKQPFKKFNILDIIFIFVLILLIFVIFMKIGEKITQKEEKKKNVEIELVMLYAEPFSNVIKIGDRLIDRNIELDAYLIEIQKTKVLVMDYNEFINNAIKEKGNLLQEKTKIIIRASVLENKDSYSLGNQEIVIGKSFVLESMLYKYNTQIINVKELD